MSFGFLLLGYGLSEMSTGNGIAPILAGIGGLVIALAFISFDAFRQYLADTHVFKDQYLRKGFYVFICLVCLLGTYVPIKILTDNRIGILENTEIFYGHITPGIEPNPVAPFYNIPKDAITVMLGDKVGVFMRKDQTYIFANQDNPLISIGFDSNGVMLLNADVSDSKNHQVVHIRNSIVRSSLRYAFHPIQDDPHTLLVNDFNDSQAYCSV
jgi:hypothetical protein